MDIPTTKPSARAALIGLAIGDALGVPVEFQSRAELKKSPVSDMRAYGTYNQPKGTWSDDSSLTFCLAESLLGSYGLKDIAEKLISYKTEAHWTPYGEVFDIGITTSQSIDVLIKIMESGDIERLKTLKYEADEYSNGNGSLMRILPLYFYLKEKGLEENFDTIWEVSALTHGHIRSAIACLLYLILCDELIKPGDKAEAYAGMQKRVKSFFDQREIADREKAHFQRIVNQDIHAQPEQEIKSSGYVIDSLEAAIWCLMKSDSYEATVLRAVNLGEDTDTTAAIAGGLAGLLYSEVDFPAEWKQALARVGEIEELCDGLEAKYEV